MYCVQVCSLRLLMKRNRCSSNGRSANARNAQALYRFHFVFISHATLLESCGEYLHVMKAEPASCNLQESAMECRYYIVKTQA